VGRGVAVQALIAHTNRTGEEGLRRLEMRLLAAGAAVARSSDDLLRYHAKFMIVDRRELYLLAFNLTHNDIERCRSFGIVTNKPKLVREAARLFEADARRCPYEPGSSSLVVSPVNARALLSAFISGAKKELVIYDPKISDLAMVRLLEERAAAGVDIRVIGRLTRTIPGVVVHKLRHLRLHTRTVIRDGRAAFVGSQSLRTVELDSRREVGLIFNEPRAVARLHQAFIDDWALVEQAAEGIETREPATRVAKRVAKLVARDLPEVAPVLSGAVQEIVGAENVKLDAEAVEAALRGAVKSAVKEVVGDMLEEAVTGSGRR
jgi:phosphatidylserine/phosphatidylglycerophosphate/cardiolipin synthase-like enzyme